jgi:hypothetical protein
MEKKKTLGKLMKTAKSRQKAVQQSKMKSGRYNMAQDANEEVGARLMKEKKETATQNNGHIESTPQPCHAHNAKRKQKEDFQFGTATMF